MAQNANIAQLKNSFKITNASTGKHIDFLINGDISRYKWWGENGVSSQDIFDIIKNENPTSIKFTINSNGGDVQEAIAIHDYLKMQFTGDVEMLVVGFALSAASFLMQAAKKGKRKMTKNSRLMIHKASGSTWGNADEMQKNSELLATFDDTIASIYADSSNGLLTKEDALKLMTEETWFISSEALSNGLIDEIVTEQNVIVDAQTKSLIKNKYPKIYNSLKQDKNFLMEKETTTANRALDEIKNFFGSLTAGVNSTMANQVKADTAETVKQIAGNAEALKVEQAKREEQIRNEAATAAAESTRAELETAHAKQIEEIKNMLIANAGKFNVPPPVNDIPPMGAKNTGIDKFTKFGKGLLNQCGYMPVDEPNCDCNTPIEFSVEQKVTMFMQPVVQDPNILGLFTILNRLNQAKKILISGQRADILYKKVACEVTDTVPALAITDKCVDPKPVYFQDSVCADELENTIFELDLLAGVMHGDTQGKAIMDALTMHLRNNIAYSVLRRAFFSTVANTNQAFSGFDGIWTKILADITAGVIGTPTNTNSGTPLAAGDGLVLLNAMFNQAKVELRQAISWGCAYVIVTEEWYENLKSEYFANSGLTLPQSLRMVEVTNANGDMEQVLYYRGNVRVIPMPSWTGIFEAGESGLAPQANSHVGLFTVSKNLFLGTDVGSPIDFEKIKIWYDMTKDKTFIRGGFKMDANYSIPNLIHVAF